LVGNDSATTSFDLDWALWNITASGCGSLAVANVVECNAGPTGPTGILTNGIPLSNFEPNLTVNAGNSYIIGVSNPGGNNTNGFTISFGGTTADITDLKKPYLQSIIPFDPCVPLSTLQLKLSEPVRCAQLGVGNDFALTGSFPSFVVTATANCPGCINAAPNVVVNYGNVTDTATLTFSSPLAPGTYTISALANAFFDLCGNSDSTTATLSFTVPSTFHDSVHTGFDCANLNYQDTVYGVGGTSPYQYKALGGGLSASYGTYGTPTTSYMSYQLIGGIPVTYTVRDANGCESDTVMNRTSVTPLTAPDLSVSSSPPCHNLFMQDSISVINQSGGLPPYSHSISPVFPGMVFLPSISNPTKWKNIVFPGLGQSFTVTVTDAYGCTNTGIKNLTNPTALLLTTGTPLNPSCNGGSNGSLCNILVLGGNPLYALSINPTYPTTIYTTSPNCFSNMQAGNYTVIATDANGCTVTATRTLNQPAAIIINTTAATIVQPSCVVSCNGAYQPLATGGTGTKKFYRSPYIGPGLWDYADSVVTGIAPNNKFSNLCTGTYTIIAKDVLGCTSATTIVLSAATAILASSSVIACGSYTWNAITYTMSGSYMQTYSTSSGCDSIHTVNLTINPIPVVNALSVSGCSGIAISLVGMPAGGVFSLPNPYTGPSANFTYEYTDAAGCSNTASGSVIVTSCQTTINLGVFIQGYHTSGFSMAAVLLNQGVSVSSSITDLIKVELRNATAPYNVLAFTNSFLSTNGTATCTFNSISGSYYIVVSHRNGLETWSSVPVLFSGPVVSYDFRTDANKAYGNNQIQVGPSAWAIFSGDINEDDNVDLIDQSLIVNDITNFLSGYYSTDLNGDGNVDLFDEVIITENISNFIFSYHP